MQICSDWWKENKLYIIMILFKFQWFYLAKQIIMSIWYAPQTWHVSDLECKNLRSYTLLVLLPWLSHSSPVFSACYVFSNSDNLGKVVKFPTICFLKNLPKGSNCGSRYLDVEIWLTRLGPLSYFTSAPSSCILLQFCGFVVFGYSWSRIF